MLGQTVGGYQITGKIAEGGMGIVYRAQHALIGKAAAIKVLLPALSANQDIVNRFFNEARAATAIRHPGIVEIFDFGYLASGVAYIVMEFLDGESLAQRLAHQGRLDDRAALSIVRGIASALAAAHAKGIVHRDLKPDNVFLVPDPDMPGGERAKVLDFGIAKLADAANTGDPRMRTRTGVVMVTPTYMSPEQCRGAGEVDHRADLYALGCILYEMITGRPPFVAEGLGEIIGAHLFFPPEPPSRLTPTVSASVEALTMQLLAKKPEDRVQSAQELVRLIGQSSVPMLPSGLVPTVVTAVASAPRLTSTPTTLGGAAAQATVAPAATRKGKGTIIAALLALALVGGGLGVLALDRGGGEARAKKEVPPAPPAEPKAAIVADAGVAMAIAPDAAPVVTPPLPIDAMVEAANPEPAGDKKPGRKPRKPRRAKEETDSPGGASTGPIETEL